MVGKEDTSAGSWGPCQTSGPSRKTFWRSASWSSSRSASNNNPDSEEKECVDPNGNVGSNSGHNRKFPAPLTPRSQQNWKARACLPPLQPLSIARRSLDEWPKAGSDDIGEWPQPPTPSGRGELGKTGERLKLDLSVIDKTPCKSGRLVKRERIAFFDKECSKVAEHIYLGGDAVARDRDILTQNKITHILNCVGFVCPEYFKADFVYRTLWLQDNPSEDITSILYDVFDYFEDVREQGGRVFVHCCQGVSRSTSLVIAYLMWREGQSFDDAFQYVKAARGIADPNMGFACQLLQCQKRVHAFPLSPSSLLRMYRIAPHSPYDPLHLVPKTLNDPSPSALDSRGAFIIHVPSAIYIWIGKNCEAIMERDARGAVCQIVRYEKVQGPIIMIKEGEEPAYFWDAFSNLLPLMDKSFNGVDISESSVQICPGERKVDLYNVDFEIFQKAIIAGFLPPFASSETELETQLPVRKSSWSVLRRKFAPGSMKEFVSAPKLSFSRVYSDSMSMLSVDNNFLVKQSHSPVNASTSSSPPSSSSVSSSSSLSSSPFFLSPDSITSDSSNSSKYFSESPVLSPSKVPVSLPLPSTLSSFSSLSISPRTTPQNLSNSADFIEVNFTSLPRAKSVSLPSKKFSQSLAERRGSLSKTLKLPMLSNSTRAKSVENVLDSKDCSRNRERDSNQDFKSILSCGKAPGVDSCHEEPAFVKASDELSGNYCSGGTRSSAMNGILENSSVYSNWLQPWVFQWPSLEKIETFGSGCLDSNAAFIFICPSTDLGKQVERRILYFWLGRSFSYNKGQNGFDSNRELDDIGNIDWNQVIPDIFTQMDLPEETIIEVVKEDEEPEEFLALLSSL
ncbi:protein-tyrosine-phosphatase MKP1 [Malania oleifera]|uniref:protein-tyrosine-phosphatase MKP1 n=1 Tax=Malania oleifera TaxID=397392 RepID=UPI0025AEC4F1|nr:protein-tyrosine-phosphatase MKP1 [Malania oleifera]